MSPAKVMFEDIAMDAQSHFFIVEDTLIYQKRIIATLKELGFTGKVTVASSLTEAQALLEGILPDCFLCDWNLPDGQGVDFIKAIRSRFEMKRVPILMVTTMDQAKDMIRAIQSGADGYVVKPYYPNDLLENLAFAFEKRSTIALTEKFVDKR